MNRNPEEKLAGQPLSVLELDNVSKTCRRRGISRTTFYEYKQRFEEQGLRPEEPAPIPNNHQATSEDRIKRLLELSLKHTARGYDRLSVHLKLEGI